MKGVTLITAGKGGVGKSTTCVLLAYSLARLGNRVLVIELDMGLRSLDIMLGVAQKTVYDLSDIVERRCVPVDALIQCDYCENLYLVTASCNSDFGMDRLELARVIRSLARSFDHVLIDTPAGLGPMVQAAAAVSDQALIVATPDPICVRDGNKASELMRRFGVGTQRLIINRVSEKKKYRFFNDLDDVIDGVGVKLVGVVPQDDVFMHRVSSGQNFREIENASKAYQAYCNIAKRFLGNDVELLIK